MRWARTFETIYLSELGSVDNVECQQELNDLYLFNREAFDHIAFFKVIEASQADTALEAIAYFTYIFLMALERGNLTFDLV